MIQKIRNQNISHNAFTLIEMMIVLIIMGIMLMVTLYLSGDQIQKVRNKTVKESILAEMQSRYSRNLGSSSYAGVMYNSLDVTLSEGDNKIDFIYNTSDTTGVENTFIDNFEIKYITFNPNDVDPEKKSVLNIKYFPYKISCEIVGDDEQANDSVFIVTRVNNSRDYCFEIKQKNCRLIEVSEKRCETFNEKFK